MFVLDSLHTSSVTKNIPINTVPSRGAEHQIAVDFPQRATLIENCSMYVFGAGGIICYTIMRVSALHLFILKWNYEFSK